MSPDASGSSTAESLSAQRQEIVQKAISNVSHIATLPEVTLKIINLVEDPDSTAQDLNNIIRNDPALGAGILKVVNSAFYGLPGQIGSINRATVLLGLNAVKNIAIAASLAKLFHDGQICPGFNVKEIWAHSIGVAAATKHLAQKVGLDLIDEAFLAGLIHDLGIMVEVQACRPKFAEAFEKLASNPNLSLREAEVQVIGATHEDFGSALCKLWKFPASLVYVTGFHHRPLDLPPAQRTLACLVHLADIVAARSEIGFTRSVESRTVSPEVLQVVGLAPRDIDDACEALPYALEQANHVLHDAA